MSTPICPRLIGIVALMSFGLSTVPVRGQEVDRPGDTARAIRELTAEMQSLRAAVERASREQLRQQVLGLYLTLQQSRVSQATMQLQTVRRELDGATSRAHDLADQAASLETQLMAETDPDKRRELEHARAATKQDAQRWKLQEQQAQNRESEALQAAQTEEARWGELVSQLEQLLPK